MTLPFNQYAAEANTFFKDYAKQIQMTENPEAAVRVFTSIMHGLRELISVEESLQLLAQLPMFLKAIYVKGWTGKGKVKVKHMEEFIDLVRKFNGKTSVHDLGSEDQAENYIRTTFIVLRKYISLGELEDIRTELPKDLKNMVYQNIMFQ